MMRLTNKNILITGATSGIGLQLLKQLYQDNNIYIIARNQRKIKVLLQDYPLINVFEADLKSAEQTRIAANNIAQSISTLDVLINNAALQNTPTLLEEKFSLAANLDEISVNFSSIVSLIYLLLPRLNGEHQAAILNVNSGLAIAPKTSSAVYCATKAAVNLFSQSLRHQLKPTNVSVLQAFLPVVDTPMTAGRGKGKMSPVKVAAQLIRGIEKNIVEHDVGKVKLLRFLYRVSPRFAKSIMRNA